MSPRGCPVPPPQLRAAERPRRPDGRAARTPRVSLARAVGGLPPPGPTPPSKGCCLQAHGHVSATWGARKPNQPESLDEGLDVTRLGAEAGHTGQQDRTDTRKTSRLRMWLRGPRRRPDGDHGLVGGVESPGLGMPRSNQTHIFNIRKPNSERESDFFQITGTGRISEQPPPIDPRSRQQLPPTPPQPSLGSSSGLRSTSRRASCWTTSLALTPPSPQHHLCPDGSLEAHVNSVLSVHRHRPRVCDICDLPAWPPHGRSQALPRGHEHDPETRVSPPRSLPNSIPALCLCERPWSPGPRSIAAAAPGQAVQKETRACAHRRAEGRATAGKGAVARAARPLIWRLLFNLKLLCPKILS